MASVLEEDPTGGGGGGGGVRVIKDTLMNITNKIVLALKIELTQKYSANRSQYC